MSQKKELKIISSTNVEVREINWLWYPFIPRGKVTILQGDPGEGKSTFMLTLAAYLTRGEALPFTDCGEPPDPITVLYQSTEDDYDDTIVPRFIKAGGIRDRLAFIDESEYPLTFDDDRILEGIKQTGAKLLVLDPDSKKDRAIAVISAAALFGIAHINVFTFQVPWFQVCYAFVLGIFYGYTFI